MKTKIPKDIKAEVDKRVSELLGFVDPTLISTFDKGTGTVFIGGQRADEARLSNLKAESEFILSSDIWKIISETIKHMAHEMMFVKSEKYEDLLSGKMWLYHVDIQKKLLQTFKSHKNPNIPPK